MADSWSRKSRSRSPPRRAPRGSKGFRWKDSSRGEEERGDGANSRKRQSYRDRSPYGQRRQDGECDRGRDRQREPTRGDEGERRRDGHRRGGQREPLRDGEHKRRGDRDERPRSPRRHDSSSKSNKAATAAPGAQQEMIIVNVNDRLGSKSSIPCLPSDTIGQLKLMVAARIGRDSGQIMLRRQGERPFKDMLSLEDYGISNGVQLDLEVDTGD
ncbi:hypothetical protein XA68_17860 [Ophiocordyceps unilateralis]|uniref:Ubiquitin-like modifier HUB1 n=1 Tax=Ophiocordyceps unilateralis TaxID=268505 RepID=A0A2A9P3A7_OPHUN|nr:hypothetical protein XA68_17860 [Ophiocordyceps unilateralis]